MTLLGMMYMYSVFKSLAYKSNKLLVLQKGNIRMIEESFFISGVVIINSNYC